MSVESIFDQVKRLVSLEKYFVAEHGADLRVEGPDRLSTCCVWHEESTPSLKVYEDGSFRCFGACDFGGSIIDAIMRDQGFEHPIKAAEWANEKYRLNLTVKSSYYKDMKERVDKAHKKITDAQTEMADPDSKIAARARALLEDRCISQSTWEHFGLAVDKNSWRIVIPIKEKGGHPIAWSNMALLRELECPNCGEKVKAENMFNARSDYHKEHGKDGPAYRNPDAVKAGQRCPHCHKDGVFPERFAGQFPKYRDAEEYEKGKNIYNLYDARRFLFAQRDIKDKQPLLLMEGFADVWSCHEAGFLGSCAFNGNRITPEQAGLIVEAAHRLERWVGLIPDQDETGAVKLERNIQSLRKTDPKLDIRILHGIELFSMPSGGHCKDANDILRYHGHAVLAELLQNNWWSADEFRIRQILEGPWDKSQQIDLINNVLSDSKNTISLDELVPLIAKCWDANEDIVRQFMHNAASRGAQLVDSASLIAGMKQARASAEEYLKENFVITTDYDAINEVLPGGGFRLKQLSMVLGKALPMDAEVLTPDGYRRMGDMKITDAVIDPATGGIANVTGVYPQGVRPAYRIYFNDGTSALCDIDHMWSVQTAATSGYWRFMSTREIIDRMKNLQGPSRVHFIPTTQPIEFSPCRDSLPLHPYLLGTYLGDGSSRRTSACITTADPDIIEELERVLPANMTMSHQPSSTKGMDWIFKKDPSLYRNPLITELRNLQLHGVMSYEKFIPEIYKWRSVKERTELLRGLMDTDGSVSFAPNGRTCHVTFSSTSRRLSEDVAWLVRSIGGVAKIKEIRGTINPDTGGRYRNSHWVRISLPSAINPFLLPRKANRFSREREVRRSIIEIKAENAVEMQCISLDSESHLFMTNDFIVTKNSGTGKTTLFGNFLWQFVRRQQLPCIFFSLEQPRAQVYITLAQVALGISSKAAEDMIKNNDSTLDAVDELFETLTIIDNVPNSSGSSEPMTPPRIAQLINEVNLQTGRQTVCVLVDHLGITKAPLNDPKVPRGMSDSESAGWIMEQFFHTCKNTNTFFMVLQQLGKDIAPGVEFSYDAGRGASQQTDFCDMILCIWRPDQEPGITEDQKTAKAGQYKLKIGKNRHGPNNVTAHLEFDHKKRRIVNDSERGIPAAFLPDIEEGATMQPVLPINENTPVADLQDPSGREENYSSLETAFSPLDENGADLTEMAPSGNTDSLVDEEAPDWFID